MELPTQAGPLPALTLEPDKPAPTRPREEYDPPWKDMLRLEFASFLEFFFPEAWADVDWQRSYETLDKELRKIWRDAALGRRIADKLVKVWLSDGREQYVLIHVEVQNRKEEDFGERMFVYNYRTFDTYRKSGEKAPVVVSFAVLTDGDEDWKPTQYHYGEWGSRMGLDFPVVKLLDYNDKWEELEANPNPWATVTMAQLKARETRRDPEGRFYWKGRLMRRLYERGFERPRVLALIRFIDWVMRLPEELEQRLGTEQEHYEVEHKMRYVTSFERIGRKRGIQEGVQKGKAKLLENLLRHRFTDLPGWVKERVAEAAPEDLDKWSLRLLDAQSLEDVFATA